MTSATDANPTMKTADDKTLTERAKDGMSAAGEKVSAAASTASEKVSSATSATIEAAKERPYAAAGIVAGVAAVAGAAVYGATKLREGSDAPAKTGKTVKK